MQEEAFTLWETHWAELYQPNSPSYGVIQHIRRNYCLINLVDNDYIRGNRIWSLIDDVLINMGTITEKFDPSKFVER